MALDENGALTDWSISSEVSAFLARPGSTRHGQASRGRRTSSCACPPTTTPFCCWSFVPRRPRAPVSCCSSAGDCRRRRRDALCATHAGPPGLAGPEQRRAVGRGSPAASEARFRRWSRTPRPDHGARREQHGHLPEPVDRARARLHGRGGPGTSVRAAAASRREGPAAAPPHRRRRRDRSHRGDRLPAAHKDGSLRHFEILHADLLDRRPRSAESCSTAATSRERKAFEEQLAHQAFHDPVTHLANRALFNERVRHALARTLRDASKWPVIFLDLDDFKTVNDSLGHAAGDRVLLEVAQRSRRASAPATPPPGSAATSSRSCSRTSHDPQEAAEIAERILDCSRRRSHSIRRRSIVRASLGISVVEPGTDTRCRRAIRNADAAMYIAKRDGKDGYRLFEPAMHERVLARLELRADLQRALERDEFELHYQPLVRLRTRRHRRRGAAALAPSRTRADPADRVHPVRRGERAYRPDRALGAARGLPAGEGCSRNRSRRDPPLTISINISVKQLFHTDIVADVRDALAEAKLDPRP